jgi:hypothetical protein
MNMISNAIKCVVCKHVLTSPVILPCGDSICKKHTIDAKGPLLCGKCDLEHPIPSNGGFPPNNGLAEIIAAQIGNLDFGKEHRQAKHLCQHFDDLLTKIEEILQDPYNFTYEAIGCLKNAVQLKGEEMKLKIDEQMSTLISKLEKYSEECKENLSSSDYLTKLEKIREDKEDARSNLEKWMATLNELKINEKEWARIDSESEQAIQRFEADLDLFKRDLLLQRFGKFRDEIQEQFDEFEIDPSFNLEYIYMTLYFCLNFNKILIYFTLNL